MYLCGARPSEICSMKVGGINEVPNGYEVTVFNSKTKPRKIPLKETPEHLLYWIRNHPFKDEEEHPIWLSESRRKMWNQMDKNAIRLKLNRAKKMNIIKKSITPHCFRKTRASIMFNSDVGNDDKLMSEFFGWKLHTVPDRSNEYDLRTHETLREKIFNSKSKIAPSYDALKIEKDRAERQAERIKEMEQDMHDMKRLIDQLMTATTGQPSTL